MSKIKNLQKNSSVNFILKGLNSIQIGLYILLGAFLLKSSFQNFTADDNPMGMLSVEIIEIIGFSIFVLVALFSSFAVYFSSKRNLKKSGYSVWNIQSKKHAWIYFLLVIIGIVSLKVLYDLGYIMYLSPFALTYLGLLLVVLNSSKKKPYYLLSGISFLMAVTVFTIPTYWYSAALIVAASFLVYGIMVKE